MKTGIVLAATLALASFPIVAQMPAAENPQQSNPPAQPSSPPAAMPPGTQPDQPNSPPAATPEQPSTPANPAAAAESSATPATAAAEAAPAAEMRPVKGELVSKLDTKTAKTGDDVVVETKASVKTADGTEIPKGSKLVGHVVAVKASTDGDNSQVALQFDHAELAGGQNLPIQTQIRSIGPTGGAASAGEPSAASEPSMNRPSSGASGVPGGNPNNAGAVPGGTPGASAGADAAAASNGALAAGTVVSRNGKIAIEATSIPGVLLANNEPGEQDPRMARASSILLGAKKDVQLDSGTPVELNVAAAAGGGEATK